MVQLGLESFLKNSIPYLTGKRWALATHASATTRECTSNIDALVESRFPLALLFSGEHGLRGDVSAGDPVPDHIDPFTNLPVISLYGPRYEAAPEMLASLDGLLLDFQDIGSRYYTFTATLLSLINAAYKAQIPVYLLDRPNPTGCICVEGNVLDSTMHSIVGALSIPMRHGMTLGELFTWYVAQQGWSPDFFRVIPCQGLTRHMLWNDTKLAWVPPSPNSTGQTMALLYPGTCLIEGTNLSEGRGTAYPFEIIGAPWIDGHQLAHHLNNHQHPGVRFRPLAFRPTASKHATSACYGVQIHVLDPYAVKSVPIGLDIIETTRRLWPQNTAVNSFLEKLSGMASLDSLLSDTGYVEIDREFHQHQQDFLEISRDFWIYPRKPA